MGAFSGAGLFAAILMYAIGLFIAYLVIKAAVRNGIDESNTGRKLLGKQDRDTTRRPFED